MGKSENLNFGWILRWYFGRGRNLMTGEGCLIVKPYVYSPSRNVDAWQGCQWDVQSRRDSTNEQSFHFTALSSNSVPHAFDVTCNISQNLKLLDNGKSQCGGGSKVGQFGV